MNRPQIDWLGLIVRFSCGAILGLVLGFSWWAHFNPDGRGTAYILAGMVICGFLAAICGDDFWENLRSWR